MEMKWVKHWTFFAALIVIIGTWYANRIEARDYTGVTEKPYPDIAIDMFEEQPVIWSIPHKLSMKRLTKPEYTEWNKIKISDKP